MDANPHQRFVIPERSFLNMAKRDVTRLAESWGFSPAEVGKVNIIVAEMLSNLVKHVPTGGELLVKPLGKPIKGIELLCLDNGPGIRDLARMLEDGVSTAGTAGEGLGAIRRQSSEFDIFSQVGTGTVVLSRLYKTARKPHHNHAEVEVGCVMLPKPNETACGDGYAQILLGQDLLLLALDGLGHGALAQEAAQAGIAALKANPLTDPIAALRHIHESIRRTRGAVGFLACLSISRKPSQISFCGIGNIAGKLYTAESGRILPTYKNIISYNGILGHNVPNSLHSQTLDWAFNNLLIVHSDGLKTRWDLGKYPLLYRHQASTIAAVLYKEHTRHTDDTLVMVCKGRNSINR